MIWHILILMGSVVFSKYAEMLQMTLSENQLNLPPLMAVEELKSFETVCNHLRGSAHFAV